MSQCLQNFLLGVSLLLCAHYGLAQNTITTLGLSASSVCPGSKLQVAFSRTGAFEAGNIFKAQLSDGGEYRDVPSGPASQIGTTGSFGMSVTIPQSTPAGTTYRVRVLASSPAVIGTPSATVLTVRGTAANPTVSPVSYCIGQQANPLSAVAAGGGGLIWYTGPLTETGSQAAPTPSTTQSGTSTFYVSQTVGIACESQRVPVLVVVNGLPTAPIVPQPTINVPCPGVTLGPLVATGSNLKWYTSATAGTATSSVTPNTTNAGFQYYYVSQTVNGCEGPRTSVTIDVPRRLSNQSMLISAESLTLCQGEKGGISINKPDGNWIAMNVAGEPDRDQNQPLPISNFRRGSVFGWGYNAIVAGTHRYFFTFSYTNDCQSEPHVVTITVKPTPAPPTAQGVTICQNTPAPSLTATGQNVLWYNTPTSGTGVDTAPVISSSTAQRNTYYVAQSLNGCESGRTPVNVVVNGTPGVPMVAPTGLGYCQGVTAQPLSATGSGLQWYRESSGGSGVGSLTPATDKAGETTYYVSQSVEGCEGGRSSVTVKVTAAPSAPGVTRSVSYCQRATSTSLTATGNNLKWYDGNGTSLANAPTPSTDNAGTVSYFVAQADGFCESSRSEVKITTKPIPGVPTTANVAVCQNTPSLTLSAAGQAIRWFTAQTDGDALTAAPVINTSQPTNASYYASQTQDGCEGPRAPLTVLVKALPSAPGVTPINYCQFVKAQPVSATGSGTLRWYNTDGNAFDAPPTPVTDKGAVFTYQVAQTIDGCESPKATLTVNVSTTPIPTVAKTTVELCQNSAVKSLEATGQNLKWTDPAGNISTTAPAPPTQNATTKADGDVYYVTQTGENGCESARVSIRVFVQATPALVLTGTTTTNLGLEVPLRLAFTGVGPYQYKLSNGLSGSALKDTTLMVMPTRTTTYQVLEVQNKCGTSVGSSAATITVNIPSIQTLALTTSTVCAGNLLTTAFLQNGAFNAGSEFKLQFARPETDSSRIRYVDALNSTMANGQITGVIPTTATAGTYWVRVMATNPKYPINGSVSPTLLSVRALPTASLTGTQTIFETQPATLSVAFTGDGPWEFTYRDSTNTAGTEQRIQTNANPHVLDIRPMKTAAYYLTGVSNGCGLGPRPTALVTVTVAPLLGIEDPTLSDAVSVYPVPVMSTLTIRIDGLVPGETAQINLTQSTGISVWQHSIRQATSTIELANKPAGVYILRVRVGDRTATKRIVKL
ncbi:MAG: T9SS C-terminal target domain-containing protein [Cytophagales bacterium]|nr:MAG: T9SS C-terminal target domain-containing protein [Cytophagales bacterium]